MELWERLRVSNNIEKASYKNNGKKIIRTEVSTVGLIVSPPPPSDFGSISFVGSSLTDTGLEVVGVVPITTGVVGNGVGLRVGRLRTPGEYILRVGRGVLTDDVLAAICGVGSVVFVFVGLGVVGGSGEREGMGVGLDVVGDNVPAEFCTICNVGGGDVVSFNGSVEVPLLLGAGVEMTTGGLVGNGTSGGNV